MVGLAVLLLACAPRALAADRVGLSAARRQLEESQGGHPLRGLCGMYKDFPAFQIGTLAPETGEFNTVANLTGIEAISQGVCLFAPNLFVTASDDAWQENQLFIVVSSDVPAELLSTCLLLLHPISDAVVVRTSAAPGCAC